MFGLLNPLPCIHSKVVPSGYSVSGPIITLSPGQLVMSSRVEGLGETTVTIREMVSLRLQLAGSLAIRVTV